MKDIIKILRELREDRDLTQKQVAEAIGKTQPYYYRYESGKYSLPFKTAIELAEFYDITTDYLAGRTSSPLSIDVLNKPLINGRTGGEILADFEKLNEKDKEDVLKYIEILKTKAEAQTNLIKKGTK